MTYPNTKGHWIPAKRSAGMIKITTHSQINQGNNVIKLHSNPYHFINKSKKSLIFINAINSITAHNVITY
ncbi:protein of unknown function [Shewanella benthica]|uniref:Uncharacterized protein n=1 Tax=Shewanella benthica TaxID=43661 RepID=A0A330M8A0_9GAMM|nr:protein of unknown function [Shewanella benthica]